MLFEGGKSTKNNWLRDINIRRKLYEQLLAISL